MEPTPLRFAPIFKTTLWGGRRLRPFLGLPPNDESIGEAWLLSDVDGSPSFVADGPYSGYSLKDLIARFGEALLGSAKPIDGRFPLLIKLIDARQELSLQVHPNDEQARAKNPTAAGKTEAWVVLAADPQTSRLYSGFRPGVDPQSFRNALSKGQAAETFHQFIPQPGDCLFLRAGTVHAIGRDLLIYECQQTSDITYRLFDWNRVDAQGQPRPLHVEDGIACADFAQGPCPPLVPIRDGECERLIECEYFSLERWTLARPREFAGNVCRIITAIAGQGTLADQPLRPGDTWLIPAACNSVSVIPHDTLTLLLAAPGLGR